MIKTYRDLLIWQKSMAFATSIYKHSNTFPTTEQYGLTSQLRRAAISVPSNIAEGYGRHSTGDYLRFLQIANGSLYEIQTQIEIALNLDYLKKNEFDLLYSQSREIERMLSSLIQKIRASV
jgi:four helix bundle protein